MLLSGHTAKPLEAKEQQDQEDNFLGYKSGLRRLYPGNWVLKSNFIPYLNTIYSFNFKHTDVLIVTYPKCGTTWMQEIIWTMRNNPNLDNPMADVYINIRCPFLEKDALRELHNSEPVIPDKMLMKIFNETCPDKDPKDGIFIQIAECMTGPRTIKCHLPLSMMQPSLLEKCKVIYIARNPKDVCVSYLHHSRLIKSHEFIGTQDKFVQNFVNNDLLYSPYGEHLKEAWERRQHKNMYFTFFECMKANPKKIIEELNHFLGTKLSDHQICNVVKHTNFSSMKAKRSTGEKVPTNIVESVLRTEGGFFRKGEIGSWKEKLTEGQEMGIEKWVEEHASQIPFIYK